MAPRQNLQTLLKEILGSDNVYFQPPPTVQMSYPCIVYTRDSERSRFADNRPHRRVLRYKVTYISRDPDSDVPAKLGNLPMCTFDRFFASDNLNHDVFNLFF